MDTVTPTKMTAFRLDPSILERLDKHAARLTAASTVPGVVFNRTDALRALVLAGLDEAEASDAAPSPKPTRRRRRKGPA